MKFFNKNRMFLLICLSFILISCESMIALDKKSQKNEFQFKDKDFSILFSHSIMGETHPCGCRHFPLGGLPQVAGLFHELNKTKNTFYIDTGDTFFETPIIPKHLIESSKFKALNLAKGLDKLGLKFMLIGDLDLALGIRFLREIKENVSFEYLISNLENENTLPHRKIVKIDLAAKKVYLVGLLDRELLKAEHRSLFKNKFSAMKDLLLELKKQGFDHSNPNHELIVMSHSGMSADEEFAKSFPQIDWIIGSHTQSFTNFPNVEGSTKIVQVLSKNHYVGEVKLLTKKKVEEQFVYHEIREELSKKITENPFEAFIQEHKTKLNQIREKEQNALVHTSDEIVKIRTANSCIECHSDQSKKWESTAHATSFMTLVKANEANNPSCIKCHSVGFQKEGGFVSFKGIVSSKKKDFKSDQYWKEVTKAFSNVESIRALSDKKRVELSKSWAKLDEKHQIEHNFANVQCMNCHNQHPDHPFHIADEKASAASKQELMKKACLSCHTVEQSPEWYQKSAKTGHYGPIDESILSSQMKKVACPRN